MVNAKIFRSQGVCAREQGGRGVRGRNARWDHRSNSDDGGGGGGSGSGSDGDGDGDDDDDSDSDSDG